MSDINKNIAQLAEDYGEGILDLGSGGGGGGGGATFIVTVTEGTLNKTYAEIKAEYDAGKVIMLNNNGFLMYLYIIGFMEGVYGVGFFALQEQVVYATNTENGYPEEMQP